MNNQRQDYDDSNDFDRPVQAARITEARHKSETENARTVASRHDWRFGASDELTEDHGQDIAWTIEDAAAAMVSLEWIVRHRVDWSRVPTSSNAAAQQVRDQLDANGRYPGRR